MKENLSQLIKRRVKELGISNAEVARRTGVSRSYINNMANQTAPTRSGQYEPGPEVVSGLARALEVSEVEILKSINYISDSSTQPKPQNIVEFVERLREMGFEIQFSIDEAAGMGPEDLQELLDMIETNLVVRARRKKEQRAA